MRLLAAVGLAGACLATSPLLAADLLGSSPPPMDAPLQQTELGSNWYIRGDVGYGQANQATVDPNPAIFPTSYPYQSGYVDPLTNNWVNQTLSYNGAPNGSPSGSTAFDRGDYQKANVPTFSLGAGYRVNDWLRLEATYQIFKGPGLAAHAQLQCAGALNPTYNYPTAAPGFNGPAVAAGYLYNSSTCDGYLNATQFNNTGFANAYVDLGHWWMINPFVGAGVGMNASTIHGSLNYYNSTTGGAYTGPTFNQVTGEPQTFVSQTGVDKNNNPVYTALGNSASSAVQALTLQQSWNRTFTSTKYTVAGQLMAGFGVPISQSATLDFTYHIMSLDISSGMKNTFQDVSLGVRYNLN